MTPRTRQPRRLRRAGRTALLAAAATAICVVAAACGGSNSAGGVKEGGVYRLGSNSSIDSMNPFVAFQGDAYVTFEYIYPMLVQYNPQIGRAHV